MGPVAGRDSQGTLFTGLCQHFVLGADPLLQVLKPVLQHQTGTVLAWPRAALSELGPHHPAFPRQSEESQEGGGSMSCPILGSEGLEEGGKGGAGRG